MGGPRSDVQEGAPRSESGVLPYHATYSMMHVMYLPSPETDRCL